MDILIQELIENLNHPDVSIRLESLKKLMDKIKDGQLDKPVKKNDVNNHIHTTYSFSPYSPAKAIWMAFQAGLATAGIMDHDSISGAEEFIEAGKIAGIATTIGVELRADFSHTPLSGRKINNPDQNSVAYMALHGIPHTQINRVKEFCKPCTNWRNERNRLMTTKINDILPPVLHLDFDRDIVPASNFADGGSITERHILYALSVKMIQTYGKGRPLLDFMKNLLKLNINSKTEAFLLDLQNPYYAYDLLGLLKSELVGSFYIDAATECPEVSEVIQFSDAIGAISAYAYLGDVGDSVTGDKKAQKFEDDYIETLFKVIKALGFKAVTYMPSRNTMEQLDRLRKLCEQYDFFQISGEDINSPRQPFICNALRNEKFKNLIDAAWALVGHELAATKHLDKGMFSKASMAEYPDLESRINAFKHIGLENLK